MVEIDKTLSDAFKVGGNKELPLRAKNDNIPVSDLRHLEGQNRIDWLVSLDGKKFSQMGVVERDETLSILTGLSQEKMSTLSDLETHKALTINKGVSQAEKDAVFDVLRKKSSDRIKGFEIIIDDFLTHPAHYFYNEPEALRGVAWDDARRVFDLLNEMIVSLPPEKQYRKNKVEPIQAHFYEPVIDFIESFKDGTLPHKITTMKIIGSAGEVSHTTTLPEHQQSMELLIMAFFGHDLSEDFVKANKDYISQYMKGNRNLSDFQTKKIDYFSDYIAALTFEYPVQLSSGAIIKQSDHGHDLNTYAQNMWPYWPALVAKGKDRQNGLKGRHPWHILMEDFFSLKKDIAYNKDTLSVFKGGRLLENARKQFPELSPYLDLLNNQMEIVHRSFEFITSNHPRNVPDPLVKAKPTTAILDINDFAEGLSQHQNYHLKMSDIRQQYHSLFIESMRHPLLRAQINRLGDQLKYWLPVGMGLENPEEIKRGANFTPLLPS